MTTKETRTLRLLRIMALIVVLTGAVGSLGLVLHTGRNNKSFLLVVLFVFWVLSPFVVLMYANFVSMRWSVLIRKVLYGLTIFLTLGSLVSYSGLLSPQGAKTAFVFLVIPLVSWVLMAIIIPIAASYTRRLSRGSDHA